MLRSRNRLSPQADAERPGKPFTGFKLARAVLSADGTLAGFAGLTVGSGRVYGVVAEASCVWNGRHVPPRRRCGCGFYCLHSIADARALGCVTENRSALLLEVTAAGQYLRYERGLRYSRQRVRAIRDSWCDCGRPGTSLADAGTGLVGWRHQVPVCERCGQGRPALRMAEFAELLDGTVLVEPAPAVPGPADAQPRIEESPIAVLTAEIALLHARLDDLQSRFERGRLPVGASIATIPRRDGDPSVAVTAQHVSVRIRFALLAAACAVAVFWCVGCSPADTSCSVMDYAAGRSYPTPRAALQSVLAQHVQWLSASGWSESSSPDAVTFTSGTDSVDVVRAGKRWAVGAVTACQP